MDVPDLGCALTREHCPVPSIIWMEVGTFQRSAGCADQGLQPRLRQLHRLNPEFWPATRWSTDASRAQASQVKASDPAIASKVSYTLTYDVTVNSKVPPALITSPNHDNKLTSGTEDGAAVRIRSSREGKLCVEALVF